MNTSAISIIQETFHTITATYVQSSVDGIEVYAFNGTRLELVQKRDYDKVHRNEEFIRKELETMVRNFFEGVLKAQRSCMPQEELEEKAKGIIDGCYKSFLDSDYNTRLTQILPQIEQK